MGDDAVTLFAAAARRRGPVYGPEPVDHPTERPWNAETYAVTPTPDGTGSGLHPDVIDFYQVLGRKWHGWRYWMAFTPYFNTNDDLENPCILVSDDGQTWQVPDGLTNPVYPWPGGSQYNSDTDLTYDSSTDELVLVYRGGSLQPRVARSSDGVTWPTTATPITYSGGGGEILSPCFVRVGDSWIMYAVGGAPGSRTVRRWTSSDALTWSGPTETTGITGMVAEPWHLDVILHGGRFFMLVDTYAPDELYAATSADGLAWTLNPIPVISPLLTWDRDWIYRATLQPHESGDRFRVWYSARGDASWRVGYTQIPLTEWPAIP